MRSEKLKLFLDETPFEIDLIMKFYAELIDDNIKKVFCNDEEDSLKKRLLNIGVIVTDDKKYNSRRLETSTGVCLGYHTPTSVMKFLPRLKELLKAHKKTIYERKG